MLIRRICVEGNLVSNKMNTMAEKDTLKIIGTLLVIAVIYCLVEVVRYWCRRNTHTCKESHPQHLHLHEQEYEKRAAAIDDILKHEEDLFKQPPQDEDCPICFLPLPSLETGMRHKSCCGKVVCSGCIHAVRKLDPVHWKCPFCRVPMPISDKETIRRIKARMEMDDAIATHSFGCFYYNGELGFPQNWNKAIDLWHRAAELGHAKSYFNIGHAYHYGRGVERDMKKAQHYYELSAIRGYTGARPNLGCFEEGAGNVGIALKHYMIAAGCGNDNSLKKIREFYTNGHATKDDYAKALRSHQKYVDGIKSDQRDEAAAHNSKYRYY